MQHGNVSVCHLEFLNPDFVWVHKLPRRWLMLFLMYDSHTVIVCY